VTDSPDTLLFLQAFFLFFLVKMSLVMMNLVLGLAISDISELEKVSKVFTGTVPRDLNILTVLWKLFGVEFQVNDDTSG